LNTKSINNIILLFLLVAIIQGCIYVKYHNYAPTLRPEAEKIIKSLASDTLLVVIPTYQDKELILKSSKRKARGKSYKKKAHQKLLNLYAERQIEIEAMIMAFDELYTFSEVRYIPDSLVSKFESGRRTNCFIDPASFRINPDIELANRTPIKLLKQFDQEWQIKIKNQIVPNPFPNYYLYRNGLYGYLGTEKYDEMYKRVVTVFQRRFEQFLADPDSRITL